MAALEGRVAVSDITTRLCSIEMGAMLAVINGIQAEVSHGFKEPLPERVSSAPCYPFGEYILPWEVVLEVGAGVLLATCMTASPRCFHHLAVDAPFVEG
jgi:hypothetical protein